MNDERGEPQATGTGPGMIDLRPLTLGELIDRSATFWRAHWKVLFQLFLGFELLQYVLIKAWSLVLKKYVPIARGGAATIDALKSQPEEALRQGALMVGSAIGIMAIYLVCTNFAAVAGASLIWPRMLGQSSTLASALARAAKRAGTMFRFFALMLGWTLLVLTALLLPAFGAGVLAALFPDNPAATAAFVLLAMVLMLGGGLIALLWWILRFLLSAQVLAVEDVGALGVFRRCDVLSSGRVSAGIGGLVKIRLTVLVTVVSVILFTVSIVFGLPALVITGVYGNLLDPTHATPDAVPELLLVPAELLQTVAQAAFAPLFVVFTSTFYADMRVRREGLDLQLKLEKPA